VLAKGGHDVCLRGYLDKLRSCKFREFQFIIGVWTWFFNKYWNKKSDF